MKFKFKVNLSYKINALPSIRKLSYLKITACLNSFKVIMEKLNLIHILNLFPQYALATTKH